MYRTGTCIKKAQAYLECKRQGRVPTDELSQGWEEFYPICDRAIRRFAVCCGPPSVADCSQDVWQTLLLKLAGFQMGPGRPPFFSWLYRLVQHKAIDQLRERTRHPTERLADGLQEPGHTICGSSEGIVRPWGNRQPWVFPAFLLQRAPGYNRIMTSSEGTVTPTDHPASPGDQVPPE